METNNNLFRKIYIYETYGPSEIFLTDATDFELECIVAQIANNTEKGIGSDTKQMLEDINCDYIQIFNSEEHCCNVSDMVDAIGYDKDFDLCDYYGSDFEYTPCQMADILMETIKDMSDDDELIAEEKEHMAELFKKLRDSEEFNPLAHQLDGLFMTIKEN